MADSAAEARIDRALVARAQLGEDRRAFEQLVRRHQGVVRAQLRRLLHGDEAAAALILHAIPRVLGAPHGLMTVLELPPLHYEPRPEPHLAWAR